MKLGKANGCYQHHPLTPMEKKKKTNRAGRESTQKLWKQRVGEGVRERESERKQIDDVDKSCRGIFDQWHFSILESN